MYYKKEVIELLDEKKIKYELYEHKAVFTVDEADTIRLPHKEVDAKNLFVRDDKKRNYYLITLIDSKKFSLNDFSGSEGIRRLSFASADDLMKYLGITKGSVSPFCLLNNEEKNVIFYIDEELIKKDLIGCHPNDNTATIFLKTTELLNIIKEHGNQVLSHNF